MSERSVARSSAIGAMGRCSSITMACSPITPPAGFVECCGCEGSSSRMLDLNDFFYFVQVVDRGGFTAAGRALRIPKSTLSHRMQELENNLGVRLLNRTSRHFGLRRSMSLRMPPIALSTSSARTTMSRFGRIRIRCPTRISFSARWRRRRGSSSRDRIISTSTAHRKRRRIFASIPRCS